MSTLARLTAYTGTCAALIVLRKNVTAPKAHFRLAGGITIPVVAILLSLWLVSNSTWREARDTAIAVAVGFAILAVTRASG
ncbi:MAG: amino acid permease-associated protein, partial [Planctomycetaceae bacterium]|nr:amino acid permease-associated protein [Planctomycetaceae bacterium]